MGGPRARRGVPPRATERRAREGPAGRSGVRRSWFFLFAGLTAQAVALELDAVRIVNDAVQNRIAEGGIGNDVMPLRHGDLTCDQQGSLVVAIIDDLEQIAALVGGERFRSPVVEDEEIDALQRRDQARQTAFAARLGEIGKQAGCSLVGTENPSRQALLPSAQASQDLPVPVGPTMTRWLASRIHWQVTRLLESRDRETNLLL